MKLSETLRERGYVYQHSSETLEEITDGDKRVLYLGVDPTADSMHVGQLQGLLVLRRFVEDGHKLNIIVGGGTGMVGDPGGKSAERNLLEDKTVEANAKALKAQFKRLLGGVEFDMVNNADWLRKLKMMEFLRDVGKHFTVNEMVKRDSVRPRLETPDQSISYTEFSYMLLQAYDFLELNKRYGCDLQVGGSDQWGNILSGVELIRKTNGNTAYALSWPLLVDKATGKKFGKSEGGAVWLDATKTSPYKFYQFWFNLGDENVEEYLRKMTLLTMDEISLVMQRHATDPAARAAQTSLAWEVTSLVHGEDIADKVEEVSSIIFSGEAREMDDAAREMLKNEAPSAAIAIGLPLVDALIAANLASSKREARQFIEDGAVMLAGEKVTSVERLLEEGDFTDGVTLLKRGKRNISVLVLA